MKTIVTFLSVGVLAAASLTACHTAHEAVEGTTEVAAHAVQKTGHAVAHGAQKVEKHL